MSRPIAKFRQFAANCFEFLIMTLAILTIAFVTVHVVFGADAQQKSFSSPEEAVRALIDAGEKNDTKAILQILGPEAKSFIETGDPVSDREAPRLDRVRILIFALGRLDGQPCVVRESAFRCERC